MCLYAVLTFIFLGPDLTYYNYEIGPKSDPNLGASSCTPPLEVLWVIIAGQVGTQKNRARVKVQKWRYMMFSMLCLEIAWLLEVFHWRKALLFLLVKCSFSLKYKCFRRLILIEFRLQLRHPLSFSCPIWQILLPQISWFSLKHACFTRASLTDSCEPVIRITSFSSWFKFDIEAAFTIWDSLQTGGSWERDICKRNSKMLWKNRLHGALRKTSGCLQFCNWEIRDFRHFWSKKFAAFFFSQIHHKWGPPPGMQNPMVKTTKWGPPFLQRSVNVHAFAKY